MKTSGLGFILLAEADESLHHAQEGWQWARSTMLKYQIHTKCSSILKFVWSRILGPSRDGILCDTVQGEVSGGSCPAHPLSALVQVMVWGARCGHRGQRVSPAPCPHSKGCVVLGCCSQQKTFGSVKDTPFPFLSLYFIPPIPPSLSHPSLLFCLSPSLVFPVHCQEGPRLKGQFSAAWQRQRLAPAAAATVSGSPAGAAGTGGLVLLGHGMTPGVEWLWE